MYEIQDSERLPEEPIEPIVPPGLTDLFIVSYSGTVTLDPGRVERALEAVLKANRAIEEDIIRQEEDTFFDNLLSDPPGGWWPSQF